MSDPSKGGYFYKTLTGARCFRPGCDKPAGFEIRHSVGAETYTYACSDKHADAEVRRLTEAWSREGAEG